MISLSNVSKSYGTVDVLRECSTNVSRGEVVVVCGPSGSGKSTLIKTVNGLESIKSGRIVVNGIEVHNPRTDLAALRTRVGMVFQSFELYPHLTVIDNLTLAPVRVKKEARIEAEEHAEHLLKRVGLGSHARKYPSQLSGGQQQRVAIARSLAMRPVAMLFDEPTSALDPEMIGEVLRVMTDLAAEGMTMMVVTHELGFARQVANRIVFMDAGEVVTDCSTADFFAGCGGERAAAFVSKVLTHS